MKSRTASSHLTAWTCNTRWDRVWSFRRWSKPNHPGSRSKRHARINSSNPAHEGMMKIIKTHLLASLIRGDENGYIDVLRLVLNAMQDVKELPGWLKQRSLMVTYKKRKPGKHQKLPTFINNGGWLQALYVDPSPSPGTRPWNGSLKTTNVLLSIWSIDRG